MIVYLTGATGLTGAAVAEAAARRGHKVAGGGFRQSASPKGVAQFIRIDLRDGDAVTRSVLDVFPDVIVNAAAVSEAGECLREPDSSRKLNVDLAIRLATLAKHLNARLIHISTDMVFDGKSGAYSTEDPPNPTSLYGRQKLEAEQALTDQAPGISTIVRVTLLTGNSPSGRRSLHEKLFETWAAGGVAKLFEDEIRQPCSAESLADVIVELCERPGITGICHWAGANALSRYEIGRRILDHFKLPPRLIERARFAGDARFADRPANLTFDVSRLIGRLKTRPRAFDEQIETFRVPPPFREWYNSL